MMIKQKVPELRFPEFSSEWEETYLGSIGDFKNGINKDKDDFGFGVPFINLNNVFGKLSVSYGNYDLVNANEKEQEVYNLKKGDTLFIRSSVKPSGVGLAAVVDNELSNTVYSGFLIRFRENEKYKINDNFKRYAFSAPLFRKQVLRKATSSANTNINQEELKRLILNLPSKEEQSKIGEFLSKLDRLIKLEEKKLELLEEQKKGYMQKIFSQELRFKDENGINYPEWEERKLGDIANIVGGGTPSTNNELFWNGDISWFTPTEVGLSKYVEDSVRKITEQGLKQSSAKLLPRGTILLTTRATLGRMSILKNEAATNQGFQSLVLKEGYSNDFIYYNSQKLDNYLKKVANGSTFLEVSNKEVSKFKLNIPVEEEQIKIGKLFSKLDKKLEIYERKIIYLSNFKKGLLQKIFI